MYVGTVRCITLWAMVTLFSVASWPAIASSTYSFVDLYTMGQRSVIGFDSGSVFDPEPAVGGQVAGNLLQPGSLDSRALLWSSSGNTVDLHPSSGVYSNTTLLGTDGSVQVGYGQIGSNANYDALIWSGSPDSVVDLGGRNIGPFSGTFAMAAAGTMQVGYGVGTTAQALTFYHALMWNGTAGSVVDLNPVNVPYSISFARGTDGKRQVGVAGALNLTTRYAVMWNGSADSAVNLNPAFLGPDGWSLANSISENQVVGWGWGSATSYLTHALLWDASSGGATDLHPKGLPSRYQSVAYSTNGRQQVGFVYPQGSVFSTAYLWSGSADSAVSLGALLPGNWLASNAYFIDSAGDVFGTAIDSADQYHAVEWIPHAVPPGDADLDGDVDFTDLLPVGRHYGGSGGWQSGDFNGDGTVGFDDLVIVARNYGAAPVDGVASLDLSFVPDSNSAPLLSVVAVALNWRRKR